MVRFTAAFVLLALAASSSLAGVISSPEAQDDQMAVKRAEAFHNLSPGVRAYLETLDPRDYEIDVPSETELDRRQVYKDNGVLFNCKKGRVAVTYDDGPFNYHHAISSKWQKAEQQITFFLNGNNYECAYDKPWVSYMRQSIAAGHLLASHSWSHPHMTTLSDEEIDTQVDLMETLLLKTVGVVPKYFRCPYGEYDAKVISRLQSKHGLVVVQWSDDIGDADGVAVQTQKDTYNSFSSGERHLILNHETHQTSSGTVADAAIARFKSQGIKSQTVHDCIVGTGSPYKVVAKPGQRDASWTCDGKPGPGQS